MGKGRCLIIRWGAYGDMMYCLPVIEALAKEYDYIHLETTPQGKELFEHHPAINKITTFSVWEYKVEEQSEVSKLRWGTLAEVEWDRVVNLWQSLETGCVAEKTCPEYWWPRERRWEKYGMESFHEMPFKKAGLPIPEPFDCGTMYFSESTRWWMKSFLERHQDEFIVVVPVRGHRLTPHKTPIGLEVVARRILDRWPEAKIFTVGDELSKQNEFSFGDKRVCNTAGTMTFMQTLALVKVANYCYGAESGLLVGAGLFGTPKTALCTASGLNQVTRHHRNDMSIQSTVACSPCHRSIYDAELCLTDENIIPLCNSMWDHDHVMDAAGIAYSQRFEKRKYDLEMVERDGIGSIPKLGWSGS